GDDHGDERGAERHGGSDGGERPGGGGVGQPRRAQHVRRRHGEAHGDPQGRGGQHAQRTGDQLDELECGDRDGVGRGASDGGGGRGGDDHGDERGAGWHGRSHGGQGRKGGGEGRREQGG